MSIKHVLSVRTDHSIGESLLQVDNAVTKAHELGYETFGVVDTMSISSMVDVGNKAKKLGIGSVIGCTLRVCDFPTYKKEDLDREQVKNNFYNLKVYVKNDNGVRSLMKLLSKGNSAEYFYYFSRVGLEDVLQLEDCIITTGDMNSLWHHPNCNEIYRQLIQRFGVSDVFIELVPVGTPLFITLNSRAIRAAETYGSTAQYLAAFPVFYNEPDDADSLDVLRAITSNKNMSSPTLPVPFLRDMCFTEPRGLFDRFVKARNPSITPDIIKTALSNMQTIVDACKYEFKKLEPSLPFMTEDDFVTMVNACKKGWEERFSAEVMGHKPDPAELEVYKERLKYELATIRRLGFATYFVLVQEIVQWSKSQQILVGPGRGSVGGSLIAYLMNITDVDPIRFNLLFERFINPDRLDLPDADLDFMSSRRQEVIQYIVNRFGSENVAGISNYSTLGAASSIRDVSRVHELNVFDYACSKQVEKEHGVSLSLEESAEGVADIAKFKENFPVVWKHATKLEGCMRNLGQHAAGVIVAGEPIINRAVVKKPDESGLPVVYWDKRVVEDWGLIKMDILGLKTLDIIQHCLNYIQSRHGITPDLLRVPLDDERVLKNFGEGNTTGVFQFEGAGMKKLLKDLAVVFPLKFEDIAAATALYRPGPIDAGLIDQFVAIKQGKKAAEYDHPLMEPALTETYGVITYQEQVMQICRDLCGFSMKDSDHVRRAMGKKDKEKMASYHEQFVAGAALGMIEVELEDGTTQIVHRAKKFACSDGVERTVEEAVTDNAELLSLT